MRLFCKLSDTLKHCYMLLHVFVARGVHLTRFWGRAIEASKNIPSLYQFCEKSIPYTNVSYKVYQNLKSFTRILKIGTVPYTKIVKIDTVAYTTVWKIDTLPMARPRTLNICSAPPGICPY